MGIISGDKNGLFRPNDGATRAETVKMLLLSFKYQIPISVNIWPFPDVATSAWHAVYIARAKELRIVHGYLDGLFRPNIKVTRAEALKIVLESAGIDVRGQTTNKFSDVSRADWYYDYIAYASNYGLESGYVDGTFRPSNFISRAEISQLIIKLFDHINNY